MAYTHYIKMDSTRMRYDILALPPAGEPFVVPTVNLCHSLAEAEQLRADYHRLMKDNQ